MGAFAIEKDGALRHLNNESSKGSGNCHVFVDPAGKNVLAANYGSGSVACLPIREDGSVGPASSFVQHKGTSVDPKRQKGPHAHSVYIHGPFVYACDLGTDDVFVYRFDPTQGTLTPNNPPSGKVPPGSGPRHLAFHPSARFAYTCNEMTSAVTAFAHDSAKGTLTPLQTVSTLQDKKTGNSTAEIFCHPQGRFLYVSNRGDDTIAVFAIGKDGNVKLIQNAPTGVKVPRGFAISPDGGWLVVAGQNSNSLASHKVDPATGKLTPPRGSLRISGRRSASFSPCKNNPRIIRPLARGLPLWRGCDCCVSSFSSRLVCAGQETSAGELAEMAFEKLSDRTLTALGKKALHIRPKDWKHAETEHFVYHFFDRPRRPRSRWRRNFTTE